MASSMVLFLEGDGFTPIETDTKIFLSPILMGFEEIDFKIL